MFPDQVKNRFLIIIYTYVVRSEKLLIKLSTWIANNSSKNISKFAHVDIKSVK